MANFSFSSEKCDPDDRLPGFGENSIFGGNISQYSLLFVVGFVLVCNFMCSIFRHFSIPRMASEAFLGLFLAKFVNTILPGKFRQALQLSNVLLKASMNGYMFVLGLEMNPFAILLHTREAIVAYAGMLPTIVLAYPMIPFMKLPDVNLPSGNFPKLSFAILLSSTASPLLTRMITNLKIGKSDIGRFVATSAMQCDLMSILLLTVSYICSLTLKEAVKVVSAMAIQIVFTAKFGSFFMMWVNDVNPEGKPIHDSLLVLSIAFIAAIYTWLTTFNLFYPYSAFLTGLFLPREGRISKTLLLRINFFLRSIAYPLLFVYLGNKIYLSVFIENVKLFCIRLFSLFIVVIPLKVVGSLIAAMLLGLQWREGVIIGLLLSVKGHPHIYTMIVAGEIVIVIACTLICVPLLGSNIIKRARKRTPIQRRALQWLNPSDEMRIMLCLRAPEQVQSIISFMDISRGTSEPGIVVFATDMIEIVDGTVAATIMHREEQQNSVTISDMKMMDMRKRIGDAIQTYLAESGDGITLRRMLSIATVDFMHHDLCVQAKDLSVSIIVLPFHKNHTTDGKFDAGHVGFRYTNRMMLRQASCSIGILVDRGFDFNNKLSRKVGLIFVGGKDDREALAYAGRIAQHPSVKLTIIRFMVDTNALNNASQRGRKPQMRAAEHEREMRMDDEYFADFYERHVVEGHVSYMEKYLVNSSEALSALHALEGQYGLFIVGRGGRVNSVLTLGMKDWEQCAELGPIGDILSGPNFSTTTSVLIIQQHSERGKLDGLDDDFSIM